eukprot:12083196-Ditylum_brightwellii.AAC.1
MQQVWKKIGHANKKNIDSSITNLQIHLTWPADISDEQNIIELDNPKKANYQRTFDTPKEVAFI